MKKNAMLKIAAILMVAVLLTTCAISSTFAKYTSSANTSAQARVAKWGVNATMTLDSLFLDSYVTGDNTVIACNKTADAAGADIIAPGTYGSATVTANVTGTPEVSVEVNYSAVLTLEGWGEYCPLVFYVNGSKLDADGTTATLKDAVEEAIADLSITAEANEDLSTLDDILIEWEWPYEVSSANNDNDSDLGDLAAADNAPTINLAVNLVISQTGPAKVRG